MYIILIILLLLSTNLYAQPSGAPGIIPSASCSGYTTDGICCWNTSTDNLYCGTGSASQLIGGLGASNPMSAVGDLIYGGTAGAQTRLAPNTTTNIQVLTQTGTGSAGQAPVWTIKGILTITSHGASESATAATMYGNFHTITGAYTVTLPTAVAGMSATFHATTAAVYSINPADADVITLSGTALTAGNKITSDGSAGCQVELVATGAGAWTTRHMTCVHIDGGV